MEHLKQKKIHLLIANTSHVVHAGLRSMLAGNPEIELIGSAHSIPETLRLVGECQPDVLLIDPHMPHQDGVRALEMIRGEWPQVAILVFTAHEPEEHLKRILHAGVLAYLTLQTERAVLIHAIHAAAHGYTLLSHSNVVHLLTLSCLPPQGTTPVQLQEAAILTEREREVLDCVAHGERNKEIAVHLGISEPTVKSHLASIYYKLGVDSRASAVAVALEKGILSLQKNAL
ncbi:DNA-binding response regulator [Dictyobacter alpinus]|uniref:DNA-binding response regulator n=1 Tax=Dictyobacter alpinus TaxID=2014873 RepID=A0A402BHW6_9CHLR|nr:response regulator transcription factor [Dictyobacter alpinus]GCE30832.1 DNA-binding response regulator [Dictyobacter alpinus]